MDAIAKTQPIFWDSKLFSLGVIALFIGGGSPRGCFNSQEPLSVRITNCSELSNFVVEGCVEYLFSASTNTTIGIEELEFTWEVLDDYGIAVSIENHRVNPATIVFPSCGAAIIQVRVLDIAHGEEASDFCEIQGICTDCFEPGIAPNVSILLQSENISEGNPIHLSSCVWPPCFDTNGELVTYTYDWSIESSSSVLGEISDSMQPQTIIVPQSPGTLLMKLIVRGEDGTEAMDFISIEVQAR